MQTFFSTFKSWFAFFFLSIIYPSSMTTCVLSCLPPFLPYLWRHGHSCFPAKPVSVDWGWTRQWDSVRKAQAGIHRRFSWILKDRKRKREREEKRKLWESLDSPTVGSVQEHVLFNQWGCACTFSDSQMTQIVLGMKEHVWLVEMIPLAPALKAFCTHPVNTQGGAVQLVAINSRHVHI